MEFIQQYEFSKQRLDHYVQIVKGYNSDKRIQQSKPKQQSNSKKSQISSSWYKPNITNALFWHIYIIMHGIEKFNYYTHKQQIESEEIFKIIETSKNGVNVESKKLLRKHKFKIQDVMNDLACSLKVDIDTFICICIFLNIPLIVLRNKYYVQYGEYDEYYILKYETHEIYFKKTIKPDFFMGETLHMPLKSISSYKLSELQQIATDLNIHIISENQKKKTKQLLYDDILFHLMD